MRTHPAGSSTNHDVMKRSVDTVYHLVDGKLRDTKD
jgi:hypothetical protein